jgi:hypothetical protein
LSLFWLKSDANFRFETGIPDNGLSSFTFSSLAQYRHGSASKITLQDREKPRSGFSLCGF